MLTDHDVYLFREGSFFRAYEKLGAHALGGDAPATRFAVWAPNAASVAVIGDFNGWNPDSHMLSPREDSSGIWEGVIDGVREGALYKFRIRSRQGDFIGEKADPYAIRSEDPPRTASIVWDLDYKWADAKWLTQRARANALDAPMSIYEVHLGSWRRVPDEGNRPLTYREMAPVLADYVQEMGFTHVELMPVMEHPFYGSWGYQVTGYFAPTARYGTPQDLMYLVDFLHQRGVGVLLDWVPSHFPNDPHGLAYFDGTHLYEHADPRLGMHQDWGTLIYN